MEKKNEVDLGKEAAKNCIERVNKGFLASISSIKILQKQVFFCLGKADRDKVIVYIPGIKPRSLAGVRIILGRVLIGAVMGVMVDKKDKKDGKDTKNNANYIIGKTNLYFFCQ